MNQQLMDRILQCQSLPTLPAVAVQVLELARNPDADIADIARLVSRDPALSSKVLRTVNSSFYGHSQHVSTISHALVILGLQSVRTLVLGFSLVNQLSGEKPKGFKHLAYWKRSIYAATAARSIAARLDAAQQEEAFLAALLMDIGMLVLDRVLGEEYGKIHERVTTHAELAKAETQALKTDHAEVAGLLASQWKLPAALAQPIACHHSAENVTDPALRRLADIVGLAGMCADVFVDESAASSIAAVRDALSIRHGMSEADCNAMLDEIGRNTREMASLFDISIGAAATFDEILKKANEALVDLTLRVQQQAQTLRQQNRELSEQATLDPLTGLANRRRFDQALEEQFAEALRQRKPLSLIMLDVDQFKAVNDRYGHPAGDRVLKSLAQLFSSAARPTDLAARYGGEELALLMPGAARATVGAIAESIRRAIASKPIRCENRAVSVTASLGVATFDPACPLKEPAHLLKAADMAVYAAKNSGRNCVRVFSFKSTQPQSSTAA